MADTMLTRLLDVWRDGECWHMRFAPDDIPRCHAPGQWGQLDALDLFSRQARWCNKHKMHNDRLVVPEFPAVTHDVGMAVIFPMEET